MPFLKAVSLWILLSLNSSYMKWIIFLLVFLLFSSCSAPKNKKNDRVVPDNNVVMPSFSADSAYSFVKTQCDFGSRVPGLEAHHQCKEFFIRKFKQFNADTIIVQEGEQKLYNSKKMPLYNIIASYNIKQSNRVLICAHWDSRPFSDQDADKSNYYKAIKKKLWAARR